MRGISEDRFVLMRHLLIGPLTLLLFLCFALGFTIYHRLTGLPANLWKIFYGGPFYLVDVGYNLVVATFIWWELPRELTYTSRLVRLKSQGRPLAVQFCGYLNIYDPDHC